jgi:hypothetical protein
LELFIASNHGGLHEPVCGLSFVSAHQSIVAEGEVALPCLLQLYHHGLVENPSLWKRAAKPPRSCSWALPLIRTIDASAARPIYEKLRDQATTETARIALGAELALLGETRALPSLVQFLKQAQGNAQDRHVQDRILAAISLHNYRPARGVLRQQRERLGDPHVVDVCLAQLERNDDRLTVMLADARVTQRSALALHYLGRDDILRGIAADPSHPARAMAAAVLGGKIQP